MSAGTLDCAIDRRFRPQLRTHGVGRHPTQPVPVPPSFARRCRFWTTRARPAARAPSANAVLAALSPIAAAFSGLSFPPRRACREGRRPERSPLRRGTVRSLARPVPWPAVIEPALLMAPPGPLMPLVLGLPPNGKPGEPPRDGVGNDPPAPPLPPVTPGGTTPLLLPPGLNAEFGLPRGAPLPPPGLKAPGPRTLPSGPRGPPLEDSPVFPKPKGILGLPGSAGPAPEGPPDVGLVPDIPLKPPGIAPRPPICGPGCGAPDPLSGVPNPKTSLLVPVPLPPPNTPLSELGPVGPPTPRFEGPPAVPPGKNPPRPGRLPRLPMPPPKTPRRFSSVAAPPPPTPPRGEPRLDSRLPPRPAPEPRPRTLSKAPGMPPPSVAAPRAICRALCLSPLGAKAPLPPPNEPMTEPLPAGPPTPPLKGPPALFPLRRP